MKAKTKAASPRKPSCPNCNMLRTRNLALRSRVLKVQRQLREEQALSARLTQQLRDLDATPQKGGPRMGR